MALKGGLLEPAHRLGGIFLHAQPFQTEITNLAFPSPPRNCRSRCSKTGNWSMTCPPEDRLAAGGNHPLAHAEAVDFSPLQQQIPDQLLIQGVGRRDGAALSSTAYPPPERWPTPGCRCSKASMRRLRHTVRFIQGVGRRDGAALPPRRVQHLPCFLGEVGDVPGIQPDAALGDA